MKKYAFKLILFFMGFFIAGPVSAQLLKKVIVVAGAGAVAISKNGKNNKNNANQKQSQNQTPNKGVAFIDTNKKYDLSGKWEGTQYNGQLIMRYEISLAKTGDNTYSGVDYCLWVRSANNSPMNYKGSEPPHSKKIFTGSFKGDHLDFNEISELGDSKWGLNKEQFKLIYNNDSLAFISGDGNYGQRRFYLKRTGEYPAEDQKYVFDASKIKIDTAFYMDPNPGPIKYNDNGSLKIIVSNNTAIDFPNVNFDMGVSREVNSVQFNGGSQDYRLAPNGKREFNIGVSTNLGLPSEPIEFGTILSVNGVPLATKKFSIATAPFFKTTTLKPPVYSSARMRAVANYYGFGNTPYKNVAAELEPLVASGDKIAGMWKAVFLSMGWGGYKIDEALGFTIGKNCIKTVEDKARNGDAEACFLMFYACQMGLEGDSGETFSMNFLSKAADAGFKPAVYDYAKQLLATKDYGSAYSSLINAYNMGVKKAASIIAMAHVRGLSVSPDPDSAVMWYKKGIAFGDPDAMLGYANLIAKGVNDTPPNIVKAMQLSTEAAAKNCTAAMIFNGAMYLEGKKGIPKNIPLAIKWFKDAALQGDRQGMVELGQTYIYGNRHQAGDENSGIFWIKKAAELGSPKAMIMLTKFYNDGTVVEKNVIIARFWYNQAALGGYANPDATGLKAGMDNFMNFWKYADFSPSYIYVNEYGQKVADGDDGFTNGLITGVFGSMMSYYGNQQQLIDGLEYIYKKNGYKVYGGTLSSRFVSSLYLKKGQKVNIRAYGIISTGMMSGPANANGLGNAWAEYRIVPTIPCSAVMAGSKDAEWQFIGQSRSFTAPKDGPIVFGLNGIDYRNYKGYFDLVVEVPVNN